MDYTYYTLRNMNMTPLWNHSINIPELKQNSLYQLCATGDADLNGRKYVALAKDTNLLDPNVREKYNLL